MYISKKAQLLKCIFNKFKYVAITDVEELLRTMRRQRTKQEFIASVVLEPEEYTTNIDMFGKCLRKLKKDMEILKCENDKLRNEIDCVRTESDKSKQQLKQLQQMTNADYMLDEVMTKLRNKELDAGQYRRLMSTVLKVVEVSDGHLSFDTLRHKVDAVICRKFDDTKPTMRGYDALDRHTKNVNLFIKVKCRNNEIFQRELIEHMANTNQWKNVVSAAVKVSDRLDVKQSVIQFINSGCSLRRFCANNAERHKIFNHKTVQSEATIQKARDKEQLKSEKYDFIELQVSNAESKYHNDSKDVRILTFHCKPSGK